LVLCKLYFVNLANKNSIYSQSRYITCTAKENNTADADQ